MLKDVLNQFVVGVQDQSLCTSEHGGSMPAIPYIFIISCILRLSSERVTIEEMFSFFSFSTLTSSLSAKSFAEECSQSIGLILQLVGGNFFLEVIGHICIDTLEMNVFLLFSRSI